MADIKMHIWWLSQQQQQERACAHHMYGEDSKSSYYNHTTQSQHPNLFCINTSSVQLDIFASVKSFRSFPTKKKEELIDWRQRKQKSGNQEIIKMMKMVQENQEIRKGPWTEQEDILLINFVHLFGDRRWDFIAKVSGLNRTGKSCRLRWVNYLHPGLKRGKMTSQEERLVLELHNKWGNRWSRIARKLPGRTDNEIKNYWRTHMRKKAQERKKGVNNSPSNSSSSNSDSSSSTVTTGDSFHFSKTGTRSFYDTGGSSDDHDAAAAAALIAFPGSNLDDNHQGLEGYDEKGGFYSMDDIWKDIDLSEEKNMMIKPVCPPIPSPSWEDCIWDDLLWKMDEFEESKNMILPQIDENGIGKANLTG